LPPACCRSCPVGSTCTFDLIYERRTIRSQTETFAPVLFATVLLALGWVLVLQPEGWSEVDIFGGPLSGRPELPNEVLRFGFLGAYSFILQDIVRRYFRDDLKTGAYVAGVARIVFVTLILVAVQAILHGFEGEPNYWHVLEFKRHGWLHSDSRRSGRRRNERADRAAGAPASVVADLTLPEPATPPTAVTAK
jgi:hypothetical protein